MPREIQRILLFFGGALIGLIIGFSATRQLCDRELNRQDSVMMEAGLIIQSYVRHIDHCPQARVELLEERAREEGLIGDLTPRSQ